MVICSMRENHKGAMGMDFCSLNIRAKTPNTAFIRTHLSYYMIYVIHTKCIQ